MSHTNTTTNFGLPQFITTDKPAWLTDVNVAYAAIDTAMKNNQTAAANAQGDATQALLDAASAGTTATGADAKGSGALASIADTFSTTDTYNAGDLVIYNNLLYRCTTDVTTPGAWTGSTNWTRETLETKIDNLSGSIIPVEAGGLVKIKNKFDTVDSTLTSLSSGKADISTPTPNLVSPRCPISSFSSYKIQQVGNIIYFSANLNFGATSESGYAYFTSALVEADDFVQGSIFDDIGDTGYQIYKGASTSLWIRNGSQGIAGASLVNKTRMFINLIIFKA